MHFSRYKFGEILCEKPAHGKPRNALVSNKDRRAGAKDVNAALAYYKKSPRLATRTHRLQCSGCDLRSRSRTGTAKSRAVSVTTAMI